MLKMKLYIILFFFLFTACFEFNNRNEDNEKIFYVEIVGFDEGLEKYLIDRLNNEHVSSMNPERPESHRFLCKNNLSRVDVTYKNVEIITISFKEKSLNKLTYSLEITKLEKDGRLNRVADLGNFNDTCFLVNQKYNYDKLCNQILRNTILATYK